MKSLVATLALVSLYPEVQQKIFDEAKRVWPDGVPDPKHAPVSLGLGFSGFRFSLKIDN